MHLRGIRLLVDNFTAARFSVGVDLRFLITRRAPGQGAAAISMRLFADAGGKQRLLTLSVLRSKGGQNRYDPSAHRLTVRELDREPHPPITEGDPEALIVSNAVRHFPSKLASLSISRILFRTSGGRLQVGVDGRFISEQLPGLSHLDQKNLQAFIRCSARLFEAAHRKTVVFCCRRHRGSLRPRQASPTHPEVLSKVRILISDSSVRCTGHLLAISISRVR